MAAGDLSTEIARSYDLDDAPEAHRAVVEDSFVGKLVIVS
jgi:NADPH2:quinone reductase